MVAVSQKAKENEKARKREWAKKYRATISDEKRIKDNERRNELKKKYRANMSPEKKAIVNAKLREWRKKKMENMTDEEKRAFKDNRNKRVKEYLARKKLKEQENPKPKIVKPKKPSKMEIEKEKIKKQLKKDVVISKEKPIASGEIRNLIEDHQKRNLTLKKSFFK